MSNKAENLFNRFIAWWKDYFKVLVLSFTRIARDNVNIMASGMVYSTLVALIPAITFLFAFLSAFGVLQPFIELLTNVMQDALGTEPGLEFMQLLETFSGNAMSLGIAGLVSFVITTIFLMNKVHSVIGRIFRTPPRNGALKRFMSFLTLLIVISFIIVLLMTLQSTLGNVITGFFTAKDKPVFSFWKFLLICASIWGIMFALIVILPNAKIRKRSASVGVTTGTISILIATEIFRHMIKTFVSYSVIYGSLASLLFLLLYLYIIWFIFMVSAEIAYVHQFRPAKGNLKGRPEAPQSQIAEGMNLVMMVAEKYRKGDGYTTDRELTRRLSIPTSKLYGYLTALEDARILMPVNPQRTAFVPALPLDKITVTEVVSVLYGVIREDEVETMGDAISQEVSERGIRGLGDLTLENLMERI